MSRREALSRYTMIIDRLRKTPCSLQEIMDHLDRQSEYRNDDFRVSGRTLHRDMKDILDLYNIEIEYDKSLQKYRITNDEPEINHRMLEAFDVCNALKINEGISEYMHFEKRRPTGTENLYGLLHAIRTRVILKFTYEKYREDEQAERKVEPYALKEFRNRWYLMAKDLNDGHVKSFAFDRLSDVNITTKKFPNPQFSVEEHYRHCFGIISPNGQQPEEVILSFTPLQGKYIKSMPLHDTQEILQDDTRELRIKLRLFITFDFIMELLSYGHNVKVIQPAGLILQMKNIYREALDHYEQ